LRSFFYLKNRKKIKIKKMSDRLLFKFYKSYFDVASELNDKDRLAFYDALMSKEFYNIEPELKGMAKFAYISQKHSIDKQVEGWESKMKTHLQCSDSVGIAGGVLGGIAGGGIQEEVQEKEKEEVKYRAFAHLSISVFEFNKLIEAGYKKDDIDTVLDSIENYKDKKKYTSLYLTALNWLKKNKPDVAKEIPGETMEERTRRLYVERIRNEGQKQVY